MFQSSTWQHRRQYVGRSKNGGWTAVKKQPGVTVRAESDGDLAPAGGDEGVELER